MQTELSQAGYGTNVGEQVKLDHFRKDLQRLLNAYEVNLVSHPFGGEGVYMENRKREGQPFSGLLVNR